MGTIQKFFKGIFGKKETPKNIFNPQSGNNVSIKKDEREVKSTKGRGYTFKGSNNRKHTAGRLRGLSPHHSESYHGNPIYSPKRTKLKGYQKCG